MWYCIKQNTGTFWYKYMHACPSFQGSEPAISEDWFDSKVAAFNQTFNAMEDMISDGILEVEARM